MWFLKNSAWLLIFFVAVLFGYQNRNETVSALHVAGTHYGQTPLILVVLVAFVLGMMTGFVLTLFHQLKVRSAMNRMSRENKDLKRELSQLRNLALEDLNLGERSGAARG